MSAVPEEFYRIQKLPPYVFAVINEMKAKARAAQLDVIDLGMGNPDGATPRAGGQQADRGGAQSAQSSLFRLARHSADCARRSSSATRTKYGVDARSREGSHRHHRRQGRAGASAVRRHRPGRRGGFAEPRLSDPSVRRHHGRRPRLHAAHARSGDVSERPGGSVPHVHAQAEDDPDFVPAQSDHAVRGPRFLPGDRAPGARITAP